MTNLLLSEYKWNLPSWVGKCNVGGLTYLLFISSNASCCSFLQMTYLPFLVKSYIGLSNFCNSGQNILKKLTIPVKPQQPFGVVGSFNFCIASNLLLNGLTQTFLSFINIVFPMYCNSVLNNWHFFGDILRPFLRKAFSKSSNFAMLAFFEGVKSSKSSIIASQCFLLCKQSNIVFIYDCQIEGEMFNPIDILWYIYTWSTSEIW